MKQEQPNCASPEALRLDNQLCFALYSTSLMMTKAYKPLLDKIGLTYPQYLVMLILWQQDGIGLKDISEQLFIDSGALTPVIKRMEVMGLLTRVRPAHNERSLEISLTAQGQQLKTAAAQINQQIGIQCGIALADIQHLRQELQQLRQQIQQKLL
ncbi:MAG: MarR family transcriptional regulator [Gammaproteobacteria bacterium]|nr:MarR family transcriptional regulator [Gammaproteobacteria bacterium]